MPDLVERLVKTLKMRCGRILGLMLGRTQKSDVDLKRRIAQQAKQLRLGGDLGRHQVDDGNLQRANVLTRGAIFGHDEDAFAFKGGAGREIGGNLYGHECHLGAEARIRS